MINLAILASGGGSNAEALLQYFKNHPTIRVRLIVSNKATAGVLDRADNHQIEKLVVNRTDFYDTENFLNQLKTTDIDLIVLAGFLWLIPPYLVAAFPDKILNIHPALLPKYGGKGMYGQHIHRAVFENKETESGITIHYVNTEYDEGNIILQARCPLLAGDSPEVIGKKVLALEHRFYKVVVEMVGEHLHLTPQ